MRYKKRFSNECHYAGDILQRYYRRYCIRSLAGSIQIHGGVIRDAMPAAIPVVIDTGIAADIFCPRALPRTVGGIAAGNTSECPPTGRGQYLRSVSPA
jgi:hypothetical protein